jgi:hypothetical protein
MPAEDWVEKVMQYRLAVGAYCKAVDHIDITTGLGREWQLIEAAREAAERARSALLRLRSKPVIQTWVHSEVSDLGTEEWVLGDVGQHGG